jgi:hypothetical protein
MRQGRQEAKGAKKIIFVFSWRSWLLGALGGFIRVGPHNSKTARPQSILLR